MRRPAPVPVAAPVSEEAEVPVATPELKRKLTAILSADVKGYSRLMGEDEEWMSFWMGIQGDPTAEAVETILASEVPVA